MKEGKGTLFKRVDGKFMIYVPLNLATDTAFPFTDDLKKTRSGKGESIKVHIVFEENPARLIITKIEEKEDE